MRAEADAGAPVIDILGGVFGVVEHRLPAAKPQDAKAPSGYMSTAYVVKVAESVGFKLAASSEVISKRPEKLSRTPPS